MFADRREIVIEMRRRSFDIDEMFMAFRMGFFEDSWMHDPFTWQQLRQSMRQSWRGRAGFPEEFLTEGVIPDADVCFATRSLSRQLYEEVNAWICDAQIEIQRSDPAIGDYYVSLCFADLLSKRNGYYVEHNRVLSEAVCSNTNVQAIFGESGGSPGCMLLDEIYVQGTLCGVSLVLHHLWPFRSGKLFC